MQDKNILITGGTSGMGKATAEHLAQMGAQLLLMSRNSEKGEAAASEIRRTSGNDKVTFVKADLSLLSEMRQAADNVRQRFDRLDVLIHAAGGSFPPERALTSEGLELNFAVQYLARFVLTNELLELLKATPAPQVLSLAGGSTISGQVDFDNLQGEKKYNKFGSIANSSRLNDLLTLEQIAHYPEITFYNYGPGLVRTATIMISSFARLFFNTVGRPFTRSAERAAKDMVMLLTGDYPSGFYGRSLKRNEPSETADTASCERLWKYSETLVEQIK